MGVSRLDAKFIFLFFSHRSTSRVTPLPVALGAILKIERIYIGLNGERAGSCPQAYAPVFPDASSSPYTYKRQLPAVGLLPSGPEPVPAIMVHGSFLRRTHGPVLSLQDGES